MRWAYTQEVTSGAKQLTSLALVLALSGSQAVLTACMALCLSAAPPAETPHDQSAPVGHAAHASASTPAVSSGHGHHAVPATLESHASGDERSSSPEASAARLTPACDSCCLDGQVALAAPADVERVHAPVPGSAPLALPVASFLLTTASFGALPPGPPVPLPSPVTAPLPLRI